MMKKLMVFLLAVMMVISGNLQAVVHADGNYVLDENFSVSSASELSGWTFERRASTDGASYQTYTPDIVNNHLKIQPTEEGYDAARAVYTFPEGLKGAIKVSYKIGLGEGISTRVSVNANNVISNFDEDHSVSIAWTGSAEAPYTFGKELNYYKNGYRQWYEVESYIDLVGKKAKTTVTLGNSKWESEVANIESLQCNQLQFTTTKQSDDASDFTYLSYVKVEHFPLGFSVNSQKLGNIFDQNDNETFAVSVGNYSDEKKTAKLVWEAVNDYTGETKRGEKAAFSAKAGERTDTEIKVDIKKFGTYTMTVHLMYLKDGIYVEENEPRVIKFSKILASNNGERNTNFGFAVQSIEDSSSDVNASDSFDVMEKAGAMGMRGILTWQSCTVGDGSVGTTVPSRANQAILDEIEARGMKSIITLAYGHTTLVDQNGNTPDSWRAPKSDIDIHRFGNYCTDIAELTKDYAEYYEIWNEWDGGFNVDRLGVKYYVKILKKAYEKIKAVNPNAKVLCNSFGGNDYFESALDAGVYEYCDGFVMHGYMQQSYFPNSIWLTDYKDSRLDVIRNYEKKKGYSTRKNMYFNENGISTAINWDYAADKNHNWRTVTEDVQAEIVPKYVAFARAYDLTDQIYWFTLLDSGADDSQKSNMWGVMHYPNGFDTPYLAKQSYASIAAMNKLMNGGITNTSWNNIETTRRVKRLVPEHPYYSTSTEYMDAYENCAYVFQRGANDGLGNNLAVLWSETPMERTLKLGCSTVDMYDLFGNKTTLASSDGVYKVSLTNSVTYLAGNFNSFEEASASITTAKYDADKGIAQIEGFVNGVNTTVNADIYKNGQLVKQVSVKITNGKFNKMFSIAEAGTYTVRLGSYAQTEITAAPASSWSGPSTVGGVTAYLDSDNKICINGRINNFAEDENVSVIIVPKGASVEKNNFLYINQVAVRNDGSFSDEAEIYSLAKEVDIYIGATNAGRTKSGFAYDGVYKVKTFDYTEYDSLAVAAIVYNTTDTDKNATIFISQYDQLGRMVDISSSPIVVRHSVAEGQVFEFTAEKNPSAVSYKALIWDTVNGNMEPLSGYVNYSKFRLEEFGGEQSFHTELMSAYLNDSYSSVGDYVDGKTSVDEPLPITFRWSWVGRDTAPAEYTLKISENSDMTDAQEYAVTGKTYDVYNLKVGTDYYWRVSALDARENVVTSEISTLKTADNAPRNLKIGGIPNARDIGGWVTADGKKVKQGYLYRTFRLSYMSNGSFKNVITSAGISTMRDQLGIKSEIDLRQLSAGEMPVEYTESVLGSDVNYFRTPMNYENDFLSGNKESIKDIFAILADASNYPMVYHCSAGADRTGCITYLINGLLGVSKEDLLRDYLLTNFAKTDGNFRGIDGIVNKYVKTIDDYRGNTLSEKVYNYLNEVIEVPTEQLDFIISYLK
ncbi:MAG: tyrosine-protein phosphatase [Firmicutes bacterium]|nr:tyrosine-protein phosphatase [Bacillota bacterium]